MTGFTAPVRLLPFPLDRAVELVVETPAGEEVCGLPVFPADSDERITVLFRLSLNEFVALASAIDAGIDPAYGADAQKVWWIWVARVMCASFCEEMALCLTNESQPVLDALSNLFVTNTQIINAIQQAVAAAGGSTPGAPISASQAAANILPENLPPNCDMNALWGGCLYLVQSGDRAIGDFFDILEVATNTLERASITASAIPAVGADIAAVAAFADQLLSEIAENYVAAYTQTYEEQLACEIFCAARDTCELSVDTLINVINARFASPLNVSDFALMMASFMTGVYTGEDVANFAFLLYFTALKYGQKFGATVGIRPLTILMGLGADQLASDNWQTLCACPGQCWSTDDFTISDQGWASGIRNDPPYNASYSAGIGWVRGKDAGSGSIPLEIWKAHSNGTVIKALEVYYTLTAGGDTINYGRFSDADSVSAGITIAEDNNAFLQVETMHGWYGLNYTIVNGGIYLASSIYFVPDGTTLTITKIRLLTVC